MRVSGPHQRRRRPSGRVGGGTDDGRQLAQRMRRERTDAVNRAMDGLSPADRRLLEKALPALEALGERLKDRRP